MKISPLFRKSLNLSAVNFSDTSSVTQMYNLDLCMYFSLSKTILLMHAHALVVMELHTQITKVHRIFPHREGHCYGLGSLGPQAVVVQVDSGVPGLQVAQEMGHGNNAQTLTALAVGSSPSWVILLLLLWITTQHRAEPIPPLQPLAAT